MEKKNYYKYKHITADGETLLDTTDAHEALLLYQDFVNSGYDELKIIDASKSGNKKRYQHITGDGEVMLDTTDAHEALLLYQDLVNSGDDTLKIYDVTKSGKKLNTMNNIILDDLL